MFQPTRRVPGTKNVKTMERTIEKIEWVVGWSTKQNNLHIRRTTNYFDECDFNKAYAKYLLMSNKSHVIYCYMNKRVQYADGSVKLERIYSM